jgi:hypothetical protein
MKKDTYLTDLMSVPPKQKIPITPFDLKTQQEAFSVSLEGLKGVRELSSWIITNLSFADWCFSGIHPVSFSNLLKQEKIAKDVKNKRGWRKPLHLNHFLHLRHHQ